VSSGNVLKCSYIYSAAVLIKHQNVHFHHEALRVLPLLLIARINAIMFNLLIKIHRVYADELSFTIPSKVRRSRYESKHVEHDSLKRTSVQNSEMRSPRLKLGYKLKVI
jgi:hypothetical protein